MWEGAGRGNCGMGKGKDEELKCKCPRWMDVNDGDVNDSTLGFC